MHLILHLESNGKDHKVRGNPTLVGDRVALTVDGIGSLLYIVGNAIEWYGRIKATSLVTDLIC